MTFLWYWGSSLAAATTAGSTNTSLADSNPHELIGIGIGITFLMWSVAAILFCGLPEYYRQAPGKVTAFYLTVFRRKMVLVCFGILLTLVFHMMLILHSGFFMRYSYRITGYRPRTDATGFTSGQANMRNPGK